jgi:hypothetical protein
MHDAYNDKRFSDADGDVWKASETDIQFMKDMLTKLKDAENELEEFTKKMKIG